MSLQSALRARKETSGALSIIPSLEIILNFFMQNKDISNES